MTDIKNPKYIAIYYPQFHQIDENDKAWGEGFTDWDRVKTAQSLFDGHYQPRTPLNNEYYDASQPETIAKQTQLAEKNGIDAFCFYHYWFDGKLLLHKPMENFVANESINTEFCISWANETWSKRWVGQANTIIQQQSHTPSQEIWKNHFDYLLPFFKDRRYILIKNKPMFLIYQPSIINKLAEMIDFWNRLAVEEGFDGIYFVATKRQNNMSNICLQKFDGIMKFQPQEVVNSHLSHERGLLMNLVSNFSFYFPEKWRSKFASFYDKRRKTTRINTVNAWHAINKNAFKKVSNYDGTIFESFFVNWDNTPRYGQKANVYSFEKPQLFGKFFKNFKNNVVDNNCDYLFINAWNEWAEGAYLEPDDKYGFEYLDEIKKSKL